MQRKLNHIIKNNKLPTDVKYIKHIKTTLHTTITNHHFAY